MSIPNLLYKIKGSDGIDNRTILYLCIIILVGLASFGLGRLSVDGSMSQSDKGIIITNSELPPQSAHQQAAISTEQFISHRYVASKNGKLYYEANCSGAKRIKNENQVWFDTPTDAEKSGYKLSTSCK